MIKLKKLTFVGFRTPKHTATVQFSNEPVTVIFGENGSGKTTYLRAINAFLSQDSSYLDSISVQRIDCDFSYDETIEKYDENGLLFTREIVSEGLDAKVSVEKIDGQYDWTEFENSSLIKTKSLSLGVERGVATQQSRIESDVFLNYFLHSGNRERFQSIQATKNSGLHELAEDISRYIRSWQLNSTRSKRSELKFDGSHVNLQNIKLDNIEKILSEHYRFAREIATKQIQDALFDTLAFAVSNEDDSALDISRDYFIEALKSSRHRLVEALSDNLKNEFKNFIISKLKELDSEASYDAIYDMRLLKALLWNMMEKLSFERLLLSSVNLLVEKFNKYLIDDKTLKILDDKVYVEVDGRELPISDLSSGERHMLTFLTLVLFQGRHRNFLIIDEPEISLNIKWQRELMGLFHNLAPNTQIIVASHSPVLAKRNPSYLSELKVHKGDYEQI